MQTSEIITLTASICALVIVILLITGAVLGNNLKEKLYRWFFLMLIANLLGTCCEIITACLVGTPGKSITTAIHIVDLFNYIFGCFVLITFSMYLYEYLSLKIEISKRPVQLSIILNTVNIFLLVVTQLTNQFILLDDNNLYNPDNITWLLQILPTISMVALIMIPLKNTKSLRARESVSIIAYFLILIVCYIIESLSAGIWVSYFGSAIATFIIYINIQIELKQRMKEQELELTESRIAIMLSQIQPHFLYNTLGAIDKLYFENAEEGHKAIVKFSAYLRGNMDSITNKKCIQFEDELSHVKQYLWLEQLRFEENLKVIYDIQTETFELPVLTLQPIVENAVRYGVTKKKNGGSVTIKTREEKACYRIEVIDDGVGFDPLKPIEDGGSHIGIANVRERLHIMCGGTLSIHSEPDKGTLAVIEIPKKGAFR